jgi:putative ATP-binding cassette transporter
VIARLSALGGAVEKGPPPARSEVAVVEADGRLAYEGLTLFSPEGGRELLKNLTADMPLGTRALVVGPNEGARIALFRATAGVWPAGAGTLVRPPLDEIFFLPQRPYLPPGTLRDLLVRSGQEQVIADDRITTALHDAGLDTVLARAGGLDREHDWPAILSLGEQQLLALTRLALARPAFAMLDRMGAALKPAQVRQALRRLDESSITYIALAEDADSVDGYDAVLEIDAGGAWSWRPIDRSPRGAGGRPDAG